MRWRAGQSVPRADILRGCKTQAPWKGVERKLQYESSTRCLVFLAKQDGMGGVLRWVWWPFILPHHNLCKLSPHIGHTDLRYLRYLLVAVHESQTYVTMTHTQHTIHACVLAAAKASARAMRAYAHTRSVNIAVANNIARAPLVVPTPHMNVTTHTL